MVRSLTTRTRTRISYYTSYYVPVLVPFLRVNYNTTHIVPILRLASTKFG